MGGSCTHDKGMWPKFKMCSVSDQQGDNVHTHQLEPGQDWPSPYGLQEAEQRRAMSSEEGWGLAKRMMEPSSIAQWLSVDL